MILFWFKEAFRIFSRAKSSFILSLITLSISILLISASFYSIFLSHQIEKKIKEQFVLNIFLSDTLSSNAINILRRDLKNNSYTSTITYTNKEKAAEMFIEETGEDFRKILDYNPLPASFSLKVKSEFVIKDSIDMIKKRISTIPGVDEIIFEHEILEKLINTLKNLQRYIFIITAVLIFISIYITYSTIKLVVSLKHEELETMKLVGAKLSTIKMPIILNELITGFLAGVIAFTVIKFSFYLLITSSLSLTEYHPPIEYLLLIFLIGPAISFLVSAFVLRKITLKI
jgi:cell division transport system permease protein